MADKAVYFIQEFVLGIGFLSGLWIYAGIDPEAEIAKVLWEVVAGLEPSLAPFRIPVLSGLSLFSGASALAGTYVTGRWLGVVAVGLAFVGGILIGSIGIWFLVIALLAGLAAPAYATGE